MKKTTEKFRLPKKQAGDYYFIPRVLLFISFLSLFLISKHLMEGLVWFFVCFFVSMLLFKWFESDLYFFFLPVNKSRDRLYRESLNLLEVEGYKILEQKKYEVLSMESKYDLWFGARRVVLKFCEGGIKVASFKSPSTFRGLPGNRHVFEVLSEKYN